MTSFNVFSWPMISWSAQNIHLLHLVHFESCLDETTGRSGILNGKAGRTAWAGLTQDGMVGLSWHWVHMQPGVLALRDPLDIHSNLEFTGSDGSTLSPLAAAMILNRLVSSLPWQGQVQRELRSGPRGRVLTVPAGAAAHLLS
ncbi:MAG: hypothetical protein ACAH08_01530 [Methylophilus sp.]